MFAIQSDVDQRENVYALVFDDSTLFRIDKLPGWDHLNAAAEIRYVPNATATSLIPTL